MKFVLFSLVMVFACYANAEKYECTATFMSGVSYQVYKDKYSSGSGELLNQNPYVVVKEKHKILNISPYNVYDNKNELVYSCNEDSLVSCTPMGARYPGYFWMSTDRTRFRTVYSTEVYGYGEDTVVELGSCQIVPS